MWKQMRDGHSVFRHCYPEGLRYSPGTHYFEPHNALLMNGTHEMIDGLLAGKIIGVPDGI